MPSFPHLLCAALCVVCGWSILHRSGPSYDETEITFSDLASKYDLIHDVVVAIKQDNIEYIEYRLTQISDPSNEFYGQYMTKEEVGMITANKRATDAVTAYLRRIGVQIISRSIHGEYITGRASIESWEKILNTTFYELSRKSDKRKFFRAREYQISAEIGHFVSEIFNTVQIPPENILGNMHIKHHRGGSSMSRVTTITPALLNAYYHIDSNMGNENASQSLFESLNQYYSDSDVTKFQDQYEISRSQVSHSYGMHESGVLCQFVPYQCAEANLDVQYLMAISQNTPTTIWYQPLTGDDVFLGWILAVASNPNPPLVHSISYGALERSMPLSYADAFNVEAIKLALQGVTIVASSGDDGVANFKARSAASECGYNPTWPASSAYVLSVGASQGDMFR